MSDKKLYKLALFHPCIYKQKYIQCSSVSSYELYPVKLKYCDTCREVLYKLLDNGRISHLRSWEIKRSLTKSTARLWLLPNRIPGQKEWVICNFKSPALSLNLEVIPYNHLQYWQYEPSQPSLYKSWFWHSLSLTKFPAETGLITTRFKPVTIGNWNKNSLQQLLICIFMLLIVDQKITAE